MKLMIDEEECIGCGQCKSVCIRDNIEIDDVERQHLTLLHGKIAAHICKTKYGLSDELVDAIKYHTTGKAAMTTLEKIVFLADYIEPNRTQPGVEEIRELATKDLDVAVAQTLANTVAYLSSKGKGDIHPDTLAAYEYYRQYL